MSHCYEMLEAEIEVQGEVHQGPDQYTSMQGKQHTESQQHSLGYEDQCQSRHDG